jgi:hypothetical protein
MKAGEFDVERIAKNHISGYRRSEKVSGNLVKKITLDCKADVLEREVLTVDTASPGVISNSASVIVIGPPVRPEKAEAEFIAAEVTYWNRWWWRNDLLRAGDRLPCGR